MSPCSHLDFEAHVDVGRVTGDQQQVVNEPDEDGRSVPHRGDEVFAFECSVRVACCACGQSFGFRVPDVGVLGDRPTVSVDALELRVPLISPAELELLGPLAAMKQHNGLTDIRINFRSGDS